MNKLALSLLFATPVALANTTGGFGNFGFGVEGNILNVPMKFKSGSVNNEYVSTSSGRGYSYTYDYTYDVYGNIIGMQPRYIEYNTSSYNRHVTQGSYNAPITTSQYSGTTFDWSAGNVVPYSDVTQYSGERLVVSDSGELDLSSAYARLAVGVLPFVDLYGLIGVTSVNSFSADYRGYQSESYYQVDNNDVPNFEGDFNNSYGVGITAQYPTQGKFHVVGDFRWVTANNETVSHYEMSSYNQFEKMQESTEADINQYQLSLVTSYDVTNVFTPYVGVVWSDTNMELNKTITSESSSGCPECLYSSTSVSSGVERYNEKWEQENNIGVVFGASFNITDGLDLNVSGRALDQNGGNASLVYRFNAF